MRPGSTHSPAKATPTSAEVLRAYWRSLLRDPSLLLHFFVRSREAFRRFGWRGPWGVMRARIRWWQRPSYAEWIRRYDTLSKQDMRMIRRAIGQMGETPKITVLLRRGSREAVARSARSIFDQLYPNWEVLIATAERGARWDASWERFAEKIQSIEVSGDSNDGFERNALLQQASGSLVAFLRPGDLLSPHALYLVARESTQLPQAAMIYGDEDRLDESGNRCCPVFQTSWNDELAMHTGLPGSFVCWRTNLVRQFGGWRDGAADEADWDLALRVSEQVGRERIHHLPHVLVHCAVRSTRKSADVTGERVLASCLERRGLAGEITMNGRGHWRFIPAIPGEAPLVSVVVPTRDGSPHLQSCVDSVLNRTAYRPFELLIVDNQSREPGTLAYLEEVSSRPEVRVLPFRQEFNFAAINNFAVRSAAGSIVLLLNDDTEVVSEGWLSEMVRQCLRPDVGAVGAQLRYPSGAIQHAGIVMGIGWVAGHPLRGLFEEDVDAPPWLLSPREVSAVTGACMAIRKDVYLEIGGMDEQSFAVSFNDVDLCLRLRQRGYRVLWTPYASLIHWESATRGLYPTTESIRRLRQEERTLRQRWGEQLAEDPVYSPNLTLIDGSCALAFPPRVIKPWRRKPVI